MKYIFAFIFFLFSAIKSMAFDYTDTLTISKDSVYNLTSSMEIFEEGNRKITFDEIVTSNYKNLFEKIPKKHRIPGNLQINVWGKLTITNISANDLEFFLLYSYPIDFVTFYFQDDAMLWKRSDRGVRVEPSKKEYPAPKIKFPSGSIKTIYIHIKQDDYYLPNFYLNFLMQPCYQLLANKSTENTFLGVFYGVMFTVILYCLLFAYFLNDRNFYLLSLLFTITTFYYLHINGIAARFIWNNYPFSLLVRYGDSIFLLLNNVVITFFCTVYLDTRRKVPVLHYLLWVSCISTVFLFAVPDIPFLVRHFTEWIMVTEYISEYSQLIWLLMLLTTAFYLTIKKSIPALLFLICSSIPLIESITSYFGLINYENNLFLFQHSGQIAFSFSALLFSFVIGFTSNSLRKKQREAEEQKLIAIERNEKLVREQNIVLEQKVIERTHELEIEKKKSDDLLLNILPEDVAEELKAKGSADAKQYDDVTVMFTDFKNFTEISEKLSPKELVSEINTFFKEFDEIVGRHRIEKIKTIGDAYMCAGGLPVANKSHAGDVVSAALEIQKFMLEHLEQRKSEGKEPFEIRIGVHSGPVVAGIVGVKKFAYDIWGDTVNIASRMESSGEAGKVNISGSTYELVKEKFACTHRGKILAKNKGEIDMYFVNHSSKSEG